MTQYSLIEAQCWQEPYLIIQYYSPSCIIHFLSFFGPRTGVQTAQEGTGSQGAALGEGTVPGVDTGDIMRGTMFALACLAACLAVTHGVHGAQSSVLYALACTAAALRTSVVQGRNRHRYEG